MVWSQRSLSVVGSRVLQQLLSHSGTEMMVCSGHHVPLFLLRAIGMLCYKSSSVSPAPFYLCRCCFRGLPGQGRGTALSHAFTLTSACIYAVVSGIKVSVVTCLFPNQALHKL